MEKIKLICKYCGRVIPDKSWRTEKGCCWCDLEYFYKLQAEEEARKIELEKWNDKEIGY